MESSSEGSSQSLSESQYDGQNTSDELTTISDEENGCPNIKANNETDQGSVAKTKTESEKDLDTKMDASNGWDYEDFDPKKPYLYEPLTFPPEMELHIPIVVSKLFYVPLKSHPKRIQRKRISSPEIKPKISRRTGRLKRSSQFLSPDSPSEGSESD